MFLGKITLEIPPIDSIMQILNGIEGGNIKTIENLLDLEVTYNSVSITLSGEGEALNEGKRLFSTIFKVIEKYRFLDAEAIENIYEAIKLNKESNYLEAFDTILTRTYSGKPIRAKTLGQSVFIDAIKSYDLTFAIGPAGTGKTYLAVCYAVELLKRGDVKKIILTRPAVEAGENLGFLPGDLKEKVDPYLRPLYDALDDMLSHERVERYIENKIIEIAPLAYMRGRTLDDAVVILDEAQNTTKAQMIMFLSRLGRNSKMIVNGDLTQIDLPHAQQSGLKLAQKRLVGIKDISFVNLSHSDVVRHPLVIKILKAFESEERDG